GNRPYSSRTVRQPDRIQVLGSDLGRARNRPFRCVQGRLGPATGAHRRLLQRGHQQALRTSRHSGGPRAGHDGLGSQRSLWTTLPTGQLYLWAERCRQQLGQGSLHGGRRAGGQRAGRGPQGVRAMRLPSGLPADALARRWHRLGNGNFAHFEDSGRVSRPHHDHLLCGTVAE
ncbi:beta-tubulin 2, partial [Aphelenchoides avenae]